MKRAGPDDRTIERLEKAAGHAFKDRSFLLRALTHSSRAYEADPGAPDDNEVLEFLGDSVIGLFTAEFALAAYPGRNEGELSKLKASATSTLALAELARTIKLDKAILLGRGPATIAWNGFGYGVVWVAPGGGELLFASLDEIGMQPAHRSRSFGISPPRACRRAFPRWHCTQDS